MTSKERWRAVLSRKAVDHIPCDYWGTAETTTKIRQALGCRTDEEISTKLKIDAAAGLDLTLHDPYAAERNGADVWWVKHQEMNYAGGSGSYSEAVECPLAKLQTVEELKKFRWPEPSWWTVENIPEQLEKYKNQALFGGYYSPFYYYGNMRGVEQSLLDLAENPEFVEEAIERLFQIHYGLIENTLKAAKGCVDFVQVTEDLGTQESLVMSLPMFRRLLKPRMIKMIKMIHSYGAWVFHHDDGAIRPVIPDLIDAGIDVLNPIQWRCPGMDRDALKKDFGSRLVFHGGVDNQQTLPFGTPKEVREEVRYNARVLGQGGGYIIAPCHNIQPITPVENIVAMYDEIQKL